MMVCSGRKGLATSSTRPSCGRSRSATRLTHGRTLALEHLEGDTCRAVTPPVAHPIVLAHGGRVWTSRMTSGQRPHLHVHDEFEAMQSIAGALAGSWRPGALADARSQRSGPRAAPRSRACATPCSGWRHLRILTVRFATVCEGSTPSLERRSTRSPVCTPNRQHWRQSLLWQRAAALGAWRWWDGGSASPGRRSGLSACSAGSRGRRG